MRRKMIRRLQAQGGFFMAIRQVVKIGDDVLRKTSRPVEGAQVYLEIDPATML